MWTDRVGRGSNWEDDTSLLVELLAGSGVSPSRGGGPTRAGARTNGVPRGALNSLHVP